MERLISLDFETTGLEPKQGAEIIEIGAAKFTLEGVGCDNFSAFCKPKREISRKISRINGITTKHVQNSRHAWTEWQAFIEWAGEFDFLVAHNANFEMKFLDALYTDRGETAPNYAFLDTLALARKRIAEPKSYKLVDLSSHLGIDIENPHRALDDAKATAALCIYILNNYKNPKAAIRRNFSTFDEHVKKNTDEQELEKQLLKICDNLVAGRKSLEEINRRLDTREYSRSGGMFKYFLVCLILAGVLGALI